MNPYPDLPAHSATSKGPEQVLKTVTAIILTMGDVLMDEAILPKRKRARVSTSPESGDDGKKRGRPRVDKQDESAADVGKAP